SAAYRALPSFPTRRSSDLVVFGADAFAPRRPERRDLRARVAAPLRFVEELDVFRIGARPAAFDVMDAERVEPLGDLQLVRDGKRSEEHTSELQSLAYLVCR